WESERWSASRLSNSMHSARTCAKSELSSLAMYLLPELRAQGAKRRRLRGRRARCFIDRQAKHASCTPHLGGDPVQRIVVDLASDDSGLKLLGADQQPGDLLDHLGLKRAGTAAELVGQPQDQPVQAPNLSARRHLSRRWHTGPTGRLRNDLGGNCAHVEHTARPGRFCQAKATD